MHVTYVFYVTYGFYVKYVTYVTAALSATNTKKTIIQMNFKLCIERQYLEAETHVESVFLIFPPRRSRCQYEVMTLEFV